MKNLLVVLLLLSITYGCKNSERQLSTNVDSVKIKLDTIRTDIYYLDYFYEETPDSILWTTGKSFNIYPNGAIDVLSYSKDDANPYNKLTYNSDGLPIEFLDGPDFTLKKGTIFYKDSVKSSFRGKEIIANYSQKILKNPTVLWFWKTKPKIDKTITVKSIIKNFMTNTIDLASTYYTYQGEDNITINSKPIVCHKVYSFWGDKKDNTFDLSWYDNDGMLIRQEHNVGSHGKRIAKLSSRIKRN